MARRYTLTLRLGDEEFKREFDSWEELQRAASTLKRELPVAWDRERRAWVVRGLPEPGRELWWAATIVSVFGLGRERMREIEEKIARWAEERRRELEAERVYTVERMANGLFRVFARGARRTPLRKPLEEVVERLLREKGRVPYRLRVFRGGRVEEIVRSLVALGRRFREDGIELVVAPFLLPEVERALQEAGWRRAGGPQVPLLPPDLKLADAISKLRPYQLKALESWLRAGGRGVVQLPTGAGKTWLALAAIQRLRTPTLILVPTANLMLQWRDHLVRNLGVPEGMVGLLGGGYDDWEGKPFVVATYNSAAERAGELAGRFGLVVYDEGHHVAAETFKNAAWMLDAPHSLVLSATVERDDGNEELIYRLAGPLVYSARYAELAERGYLAPLEYEIVRVKLPGELAEKHSKLMGRWEAERWDAAKAGRLQAELRRIEAENPAKEDEAVRRALEMAEEGRRVFVFTNLVDQAERIYRRLSERLGDRVAIVTGETGVDERERVFEAFKRGDVRVLVTTTVLDEGVDAPAADAAVIVSSRALRHPRQFVQRIGRVVRPAPGKVARAVVLLTDAGFEGRAARDLQAVFDEYYGGERMRKLVERRRRREELEAKRAMARERTLALLRERLAAAPNTLRLVEQALSKPLSKLTPAERRALIAARYVLSPSGFGYDVRRAAKRLGRALLSWLKGRTDLPGVDEPEALAAYEVVRRLVRARDWEGLERFVLTGRPPPRARARAAA